MKVAEQDSLKERFIHKLADGGWVMTEAERKRIEYAVRIWHEKRSDIQLIAR